MSVYNKLITIFSDFPGIGPRQAKRFVYFLLSRNKEFLWEFSELIQKLKDEINVCQSCFRFFQKSQSVAKLCNICSDKNRDRAILTVVARDVDFENLEKIGTYNGVYFVLGGSIPILEKNPELKVRLKELLSAVEKYSKEGIKEVVIAMSANPDGENTGDYIRQILKPAAQKYSFKISALGRGLSTGTELEYSDSETLKNAFKNRQ